MKNITVLYSSEDIHKAIKAIFTGAGPKDRRIALVAYIGSSGESYLPHPEGLRVICSPTPGGTDPDTLRHLIERGARAELSDKLHMKVYWSRNRGCIITSANASSNALGVRGLKEAGVYFPPGIVDVDKLIKYAKPRPINKSDFYKLDLQTRVYKKNSGNRQQNADRSPEFLEWYTSPYPKKWKIWSGEEGSGTAKVVKEATYTEYGLKSPYSWRTVGKDKVRRNDWLLSFFFTGSKVKSIGWFYVDLTVKISPKEKHYYNKDWPFTAVQVHAPSRYPLPPFKITPVFRKAFQNAIKLYSHERIMETKSYAPPIRLLNFVAEYIKKRK